MTGRSEGRDYRAYLVDFRKVYWDQFRKVYWAQFRKVYWDQGQFNGESGQVSTGNRAKCQRGIGP